MKRNFAGWCDDGNQYNGDGCDRYCQQESYFSCTGGNSTSPDVCSEVCGDGVNLGFNECEDGNKRNVDGCSSTCHVEKGWFCELNFDTGLDDCYELCGDGLIFYRTPQTQCDDGNDIDGDGCSSFCIVEDGYTCAGGTGTVADKCTPICGDGMVHGNESCEDGNTVSGDGCSSTCQIETGWKCTFDMNSGLYICEDDCGNGIINLRGAEQECDDGNFINNDGCSATCKIESGFNCSGGTLKTPDICTEICGDGLDFGHFPCEDGNLVDGDGCSAECTVEAGFKCSGGSPTLIDTCTEICGDGIKTPNE